MTKLSCRVFDTSRVRRKQESWYVKPTKISIFFNSNSKLIGQYKSKELFSIIKTWVWFVLYRPLLTDFWVCFCNEGKFPVSSGLRLARLIFKWWSFGVRNEETGSDYLSALPTLLHAKWFLKLTHVSESKMENKRIYFYLASCPQQASQPIYRCSTDTIPAPQMCSFPSISILSISSAGFLSYFPNWKEGYFMVPQHGCTN